MMPPYLSIPRDGIALSGPFQKYGLKRMQTSGGLGVGGIFLRLNGAEAVVDEGDGDCILCGTR